MNHREIIDDLEANTAGDVKSVVLLAAGNGWCDWHCQRAEPGVGVDEQCYRYVERALTANGYQSHLHEALARYRRRHGLIGKRQFLLPADLAARYQLIDVEV